MKFNAILLPLALLLAGCLENEEELTIRADGSVTVEMSAKGGPEDLADGYPVQLDAPWTAANDATLEWIRVLGPDTGSALVRANLSRLGGLGRKNEETTLQARAEFSSVQSIPRFFAPESENYKTAYLERSTDLRIERKGGRTVYVFERTYRGRTFERLDVLSIVKAALDENLFAKIEHEGDLDDAERAEVVEAAARALRQIPEMFARDALLAAYTQGDASIASASAERVRTAVREGIERVVTKERLTRIVAGLFPPDGGSNATEIEREVKREAEGDFERMDKEVRQTLRAAFAAGLEAEHVPTADRNALRGELEWLFTARDHTEDLGDESFAVRVHMPGTIVGGNYDGIAGGTATWKFDGADLHDRDRVLRVVSVVE